MAPVQRTVYLVRHAQSVWNRERRVQGRCLEVPLSEEGRSQARSLGRRLGTLDFAHVYCSNAERALETARIALGESRPLHVLGELCELSLGSWEGRLISEIERDSPGAITQWYHDPTAVRIEGMEEIERFRMRSVSAIESVIERSGSGNVVVITHGGIICTYLTGILKMDLRDLWSFSLPNASITTVLLDFRPRLRSFGDTAHLDGGISGLEEAPFNAI